MVSASHSTCPLQSSCKQLWNKKSYWMHSSYLHQLQQTTATLRPHCKVWTRNGSPSRALRAAIRGPPADWKQPRGRQRQTWTRTVESDLKPANISQHTAIVMTGGTLWWQQRSTRGMLLKYWWCRHSVCSQHADCVEVQLINVPCAYTLSRTNKPCVNLHTLYIRIPTQAHRPTSVFYIKHDESQSMLI